MQLLIETRNILVQLHFTASRIENTHTVCNHDGTDDRRQHPIEVDYEQDKSNSNIQKSRNDVEKKNLKMEDGCLSVRETYEKNGTLPEEYRLSPHRGREFVVSHPSCGGDGKQKTD